VEALALPRPVRVGLAQRLKLAQGGAKLASRGFDRQGRLSHYFQDADPPHSLRTDDRGNELMAVQDLKE